MLRNISVGGKAFTIDVLHMAENGDIAFRLDGGDASASVIEVVPNVYSVLIDGRSYEARVISTNGEVVVEINGERYPIMVEDPRRARRKSAASAGEGRASVTAPMPGKIVRVLAAEGTAVTAGQGVVVIEAMKMQNEMKSPRDGRLVSVPVQEGETVAAGAVLAIVE